MKNSVESLLFLIAALLGGILSLLISKMNLPLYDLLLFGLIIFVLAILLIIFWDWYQKKERVEKYADIKTILSKIEDVEYDTQEIKKIVRNKLI